MTLARYIKVKKESKIDGLAATFLQLDIRITPEGYFLFKLYDKRDEFNFEAMQFTHGDSCVADRTLDGTMKSQIKRISLACIVKSERRECLRALEMKFIKRGYSTAPLFNAKLASLI